MRRLVPALLLGGLFLGTVAAPAAARGRRSIAVLEFRQGVTALPGLANRLARRLRTLTGHKVLGPTEARQRIGALVDSFVARCQGKPRCVGAIGSRLKVSEVILIGLSSLGDVIIQISRVHARSRKMLSSVGHTQPASRTLDQTTLDKLIRRLLPQSDFIRYGKLNIHSNRSGADVFVNARRIGRTPLPGPLKLRAPAEYQIKVVKSGYVTFSAHLQVPPDATIRVNAVLPPVTSSRWYTSWWFWTVVGGAVAAGIATGVSLYLTRRPDQVPAVLRW